MHWMDLFLAQQAYPGRVRSGEGVSLDALDPGAERAEDIYEAPACKSASGYLDNHFVYSLPFLSRKRRILAQEILP